jgi:hypothetical protein
MTKSRRPTLAHLWALTIIAGIFVFVNTHPIRPQDFWWHLKVGEQIVTTGEIPTVDTFSLTQAGTPYTFWVFWLMESWFYVVYRLGGPPLIVLAQSLIITSAYAGILWLAQAKSGRWRVAALATLVAAALGINDWNVRPQAIGFLMAAVILVAFHLYDRRKIRWLLTLIPASLWIWANSHGSWPIGFVLVGLWLAERGWRVIRTRTDGEPWQLQPLIAPALALVAGALALLLSPHGLERIGYVAQMGADPRIQTLIPEWAPPTLALGDGLLFYVALLGSGALLALSPRRPTVMELGEFLAFGALSIRTSRGVIWFGLVMAPVLARHLAALAAKLDVTLSRAPGNVMLNRLVAALLLVAAVLTLPWFKDALPLPPEKRNVLSTTETPVDATAYLLEAQPPGPLFHDLAFGSYLIWAAYPDYQVFVDTRIELYPYTLWEDYVAITNAAEDWEARLADYDVQTLILSRQTQMALIDAAEESSRWEETYGDETAVIFVNRSNTAE